MGANKKATQAPPGPQPLDNYVVQKMYNQDDLGSFKSAETRLKQIMLKLQEQEKHNHELKNQISQQKQQRQQQQDGLSKRKAVEINGNLESILRDINGLVQENVKLKESQGVPVESTFHAR